MEINMQAWAIWLIAMAVFLIVELLSGSVVALCMAAGCLCGALVSIPGSPLWVQVLTAAVCAILSLLFLGPYIKRLYSRHSSHRYVSNMDALIGRVGKVTATVTSHSDDNGRVQIDGDSWLAYTDDAAAVPILPGTQVRVEAYNSLVLRVRPIRKQD